MPRAIVLNSAGVTGATGGTFADSSVALAGDSLAVANFNQGGAKIIEMWAIDSDSNAEIQVIYTRPESTHDQQHGFRQSIPGTAGAGAAKAAAYSILPGNATIDLYKSDVQTQQWTSTASDDLLCSWVTLYDDLPGVQGVFLSANYVRQVQKSALGIFVNATASATAAIYGTQRAFNADDDRLHANTWYAILGFSVKVPATTISLIGPDWGGQRIGGPAGYLNLNSNTWFMDQSDKWDNLACVPCFNSNNKGSVLVQVADAEASTTPAIDFFLYELTVPNTQTPSG